MKKEFRDIVIIGAGPSGSIAAGYLEKHDASIMISGKTKISKVYHR